MRALVRLGLVRAEPVRVEEAGTALTAQLEGLAGDLFERYRGRAPSEIPALSEARDLYKAFGIDPTRTRPSSEALLRRALRQKPMPRILNAVDVCNLCSVEFLLPLGLYDLSRIRPPVVLRRGRSGESFEGIRKDDVHLHDRPVLADLDGAFGNPTSDSLRSSVSTGTTSLLMVIFATASYAVDRMEAHVEWSCQAMRRHLAPPDGSVRAEGIVV